MRRKTRAAADNLDPMREPEEPKLWHQQHMLETNPRFGPVLFGPAELNLERLYSTILSEALVL